jgi:hypothetical protein
MAQSPKIPVEMGFLSLTKISESRIVNGGRVLRTRMNDGFGAHRLKPEEDEQLHQGIEPKRTCATLGQ